jgi:hypothetical protein
MLWSDEARGDRHMTEGIDELGRKIIDLILEVEILLARHRAARERDTGGVGAPPVETNDEA